MWALLQSKRAETSRQSNCDVQSDRFKRNKTFFEVVTVLDSGNACGNSVLLRVFFFPINSKTGYMLLRVSYVLRF